MQKRRVVLWSILGAVAVLMLVLGIVVIGGRYLAHQVGVEADSIRVQDASKGAYEVTPAGQTVQTGKSIQLPAWVPNYPGASIQKGFSGQSENGQSGTYTFKTKDSPDHVLNFYSDGLKRAGLTVAVVNAGPSKVITAQDAGKHHTVNVVISGGSETSVTVSFTSK